jgi:hypothetical protein
MTHPRLTHAVALALSLAIWALFARAARADDLPPRTGHVSDTSHLLRKQDRDDLEEKLKKLEKEMRVDVAMWLTDASEGVTDDVGREAYEKWNVGKNADNGLLFVITPKGGHAAIVQAPARDYLFKWEAKKVRDEEKLDTSVGDRAFAIEHQVEKILEKKTVRRRPRGTPHPARAMFYLTGAVGLVMLAIFLSFGERRARTAT